MDLKERLGLSTILETYEVPQVIKEYYPSGIFGFDKEGSPVVYFPLGGMDFKGLVHSLKRDDILKSRAYTLETLKKLCAEQTEKLGKEVTQYDMIYDFEGFGLKHLWIPGIQMYRAIVQMHEEHYANFLNHVFVVKAPRIFPVVFAMMKPVLTERTKKRVHILGADWREKLQEYIDPSQIPEYYGGICRDENDDPKCRSKICYGGEIPTSFYAKNLSITNLDDLLHAEVKAGKVFTVEIPVKVRGTVIQCQYRTSDYDIGFSVDYVAEGDPDSPQSTIQKIPFERKQCHLVPEDIVLDCDKPGLYYLRFDNSYSWGRSKELDYSVIVTTPEAEELPQEE